MAHFIRNLAEQIKRKEAAFLAVELALAFVPHQAPQVEADWTVQAPAVTNVMTQGDLNEWRKMLVAL